MQRENEKQDAIFHDSWRRLGWVENQVEKVRALCEPLSQLPRYAPLRTSIDESASSRGHIEFIVDVGPTPELPEEVNFLIGNIVTDARSCLDMAVESIWRYYSLSRRGTVVQFPLEGNYKKKLADSKGGGLRKFVDRLDDRFVEAIEQAQPDYADGMFDIPANLAALFISHLSNANKHRNITPAILRVALSSSGVDKPGLRLNLLAQSSGGLPPLRFALGYDAEDHSEQDARSYIAALENPRSTPLHIVLSQKLVIDRQVIPLSPPDMGESVLEWRAELAEVLDNVPAYIRLTLRNLNRVHRNIQNEGEEFYLLDSDFTL